MTTTDTRIRIFDGLHVNPFDLPEPACETTVYEFWHDNQDAFEWGDIRQILHDLEHYGYATVGGGAAATHTIRLTTR